MNGHRLFIFCSVLFFFNAGHRSYKLISVVLKNLVTGIKTQT